LVFNAGSDDLSIIKSKNNGSPNTVYKLFNFRQFSIHFNNVFQMKYPLITVFTPTYNRAYTLKQLYDSLLNQTNKNFEWLIVDDGSTDNTKELIQLFINEAIINIQYHYKTNGGKHTAINLGIQKAKGELFFTVDSDDYLLDNALEILLYYYLQIKDDDRYCEISGLYIYTDGKVVGGETEYNILKCNYWDLLYKYKLNKDKAHAYKTSVIKNFPFPEIMGENFIAEGIVLNRIASKYPLVLFFAKPLCVIRYLNDGLSHNSLINRRRCNMSALLLYEEQSKYSLLPFLIRMKSVINYWRFSFCSIISFSEKIKRISLLHSIIALPIGFSMFIMDTLKIYFKKRT
jgi:glycosyltransferase involved in cell wall biosynthesis